MSCVLGSLWGLSILELISRYEETTEIIVDEAEPFLNDTVLKLSNSGFRLCFDGYTQKLRVIIVAFVENSNTNSTAASKSPTFQFRDSILTDSKQVPSLRYIYHVCGPTIPGHFIEKSIVNKQESAGKTLTFVEPSKSQQSSKANKNEPSKSQRSSKANKNETSKSKRSSKAIKNEHSTSKTQLRAEENSPARSYGDCSSQKEGSSHGHNSSQDEMSTPVGPRSSKENYSTNNEKKTVEEDSLSRPEQCSKTNLEKKDTHVYYFLKYPGMAFRFPVPWESYQKYKSQYSMHEDHVEDDDDVIPFEIPVGEASVAPRLDRFYIYPTSAHTPQSYCPWLLEEAESNPQKKLERNHSSWMTEVLLRQGIILTIPNKKEGIHVLIGSSLQEIYQSLGVPDRVTLKDMDIVDTMRGNPAVQISSDQNSAFEQLGFQINESSDSKNADYFYNYFHHGLDLLICGRSHRVRKILLHTNFPGHPLFGVYDRCRFLLKVDQHTLSCLQSSPENKASDSPQQSLPVQTDASIYIDTEWKNIRALLGAGSPPLLVQNVNNQRVPDQTSFSKMSGNASLRKYYGYPGEPSNFARKEIVQSVKSYTQ